MHECECMDEWIDRWMDEWGGGGRMLRKCTKARWAIDDGAPSWSNGVANRSVKKAEKQQKNNNNEKNGCALILSRKMCASTCT